MNRRALLLVVTGVVAAIAATVVIYFLIASMGNTVAPPPPTSQTPSARRAVIVAATDIAANTTVTTSQLTTGTFPVDMIPADAITTTAGVVGTRARSPIFSGQILLRRQFIASQGDGPSVNIPAGKVLVAFPSTDMLNATGAVQRGDHVDIMLSIPISGTTRLDAAADTGTQLDTGERALVAQMTLQNIVVENVGQWAPPGQQAENTANTALKIITFIVEPQEALILKYVKDSGGTIDLAVRSADDNEIKDTDPVTLDYLVDLFGFIGLVPPGQLTQAAPPPTPVPAP